MNTTDGSIPAYLNNFQTGFVRGHKWVDACIRQVYLAAVADPEGVGKTLVGLNGQHTGDLSEVWGITTKACQAYCSRAQLHMQFDFDVFSAGITNYFLPWVFLTAQLPFETGKPVQNVMSFCLAVGSPMLMTFSLFTTALNGSWINERFTKLTLTRDGFFDLQEAAKAAREFLRSAQQSPMRINKAAFTQLFEKDERNLRVWWISLNTRLVKTRRPFTFSLWAQGLFAVIVWGLTIASSLATDLGVPSQALLLSSGTLWIWLIPVVVGWVFVGSQYTKDGIQTALHEFQDGGSRPDSQVALQVRSGLADSLLPDLDDGDEELDPVFWSDVQGDERRQGPVFNYGRIFTVPRLADLVASAFDTKLKELRQDTLLSSQCHGDACCSSIGLRNSSTVGRDSGNRISALLEEQRLESYRLSSATNQKVVNQLSGLNEEFSTSDVPLHPLTEEADATRGRSKVESVPISSTHPRSRPLSPRSRPSVPTEASRLDLRRSTTNSLAQGDSNTLRLSPLTTSVLHRDSHDSRIRREQESKAYIEWQDLDSTWKRNIVFANLLAFFLQWGVAGAAILIAYNTPARGMGCRPSSYLLYAILSTVTHFLLLVSVFLSHEAMLIHQEQTRPTKSSAIETDRRLGRLALVSKAAVLTRVTGKVGAIFNTVWIVLVSIFELTGLFNSCFCEASMIMPDKDYWILLFLKDDLRELARQYWGGGIAMSALVIAITSWIVFLYRTPR